MVYGKDRTDVDTRTKKSEIDINYLAINYFDVDLDNR